MSFWSITEGWHVLLEYYLGLACPSGVLPRAGMSFWSITEGWHVLLEYYRGLACPSGEGTMPVLMLICLLQICGVSDEERN